MAKASMSSRCFYEVLGTMILVSTICFVVTTPKAASIVTPLYVIPLSLYVAIQIGGKVSGGHFNPAVSLAVHVSQVGDSPFTMKEMFIYWLCQFLGGVLGYAFAFTFVKSRPMFLMGQGIALSPGGYTTFDATTGLGTTATYSAMCALMAEMWGTCLFTCTILNVCGSKKSGQHTATNNGTNAAWNHMVIIMALALAIFCFGGISGGGMNPAVGFGLNFTNRMMNGANAPASNLGNLWIYLVGPLLGAAMSGAWYRFVHVPACNPNSE